MTYPDPNAPPLRIDLSLHAVVEEYLRHGHLRSTAAFGFDPEQPLEAVVAGGFRYSRMRPAAYVQIERDVWLRHRGGVVPANLASTYLRGRYLGSELGLVPGPPLATILRWLALLGAGPGVEWFESCNAESGALRVDERVKINFSRKGGRFRVTSIVPRIVGSGDGWEPLDEIDCASVSGYSETCDSVAEWTARAALNPKGRPRREALRAVERIAAWLPKP
ncbi:hypothetical protein J5226_10430 [Lysobacter sp. K5869]|uniref:hypothetical protein n=1 Tax=Lysobacter sp. K5869 TaxID=2820808 RepID=UPI001C060DB3|nr:hypothetical protein [Lysobacter sp. K5869]QWP78775.1 hypothetical protein J5226_10430 [Lysobacter sp. K5869]